MLLTANTAFSSSDSFSDFTEHDNLKHKRNTVFEVCEIQQLEKPEKRLVGRGRGGKRRRNTELRQGGASIRGERVSLQQEETAGIGMDHDQIHWYGGHWYGS